MAGHARGPRIVVQSDVTIDPASLATMTGAVSSGITVTGAAVGDVVQIFPPYNTQGILLQGYVTAANTVAISLFNPTAGTIDLASGTWHLVLWRK